MNIRKLIFAFAALLASAGCRNPEEQAVSAPAPPPAAAVAPGGEAMPLDTKLGRLDAELTSAIGRRLEGNAIDRLFRAEAMTDRLLEGDPPVQWLAEGYQVEAKLRQVQAMADRIISQLRRGTPREEVLQDVIFLDKQVRSLRVALAQPGAGKAPVPLDSLLARFGEAAVDSTKVVE